MRDGNIQVIFIKELKMDFWYGAIFGWACGYAVLIIADRWINYRKTFGGKT